MSNSFVFINDNNELHKLNMNVTSNQNDLTFDNNLIINGNVDPKRLNIQATNNNIGGILQLNKGLTVDANNTHDFEILNDHPNDNNRHLIIRGTGEGTLGQKDFMKIGYFESGTGTPVVELGCRLALKNNWIRFGAATNNQRYIGYGGVSSNGIELVGPGSSSDPILKIINKTGYDDIIECYSDKVKINKKLNVTGDINFTGEIAKNGSPLVSSLWTEDGNNIYYNSGDVGIGTTTNPSYKLDVNGDIRASETIYANKIIGTYSSHLNVDTHLLFASNKYIKYNNYLRFYQQDLGDTLTLDNNGNIGIGTSSPINKLHVEGNLRVKDGNIYMHSGGHTGIIDMTLDEIIIGKDDFHNSIKIRTDNDWTRFMRSNYEILSLSENNILLHRETTINNGKLNITGGDINLQSSGNYSSNTHKIYWSAYNGGETTAYILYQGNSSETLTIAVRGASGNIKFKTSNGAVAATTRLTITNDGNIGIGTTTPDANLHVIGTHNSNPPSSRYVYYNGSSIHEGVHDYSSQPRPIAIKFKGFMWGYDEARFIQSSDSRIKTNIEDVPDNLALEQLRNIPCRYYEYIDKINRGMDKTIGFIAQEVKSIIPMAVSQQKAIIPNIYKIINCTWTSNDDTFIMSSSDLSDVSGVKYKFYVSNASDGSDEKEIEIKGNSDNTFTFDTQYINVFCYGSEVEDFHTLDKHTLFTLNFSATQEIDRQQIADKQRITNLETENATLKAIIDKLTSATSFEEFKNSL